MPDKSKMSQDRWDIRVIGETDMVYMYRNIENEFVYSTPRKRYKHNSDDDDDMAPEWGNTDELLDAAFGLDGEEDAGESEMAGIAAGRFNSSRRSYGYRRRHTGEYSFYPHPTKVRSSTIQSFYMTEKAKFNSEKTPILYMASIKRIVTPK